MKILFLNLIRSLKYGLQNFGRNGFLSIATTSIMVLTLFGLGFFVVLNKLSNNALSSVQDRIDISVYMQQDADPKKIDELVSMIRGFNEVREIEYLSKDKALEVFKTNFKDNKEILDSLNVIDNPLPITINIKAKDSANYAVIADRINKSEYKDNVIADVNYNRQQTKTIIERLNTLIKAFRNTVLVTVIILAVIAALITFNTIRLTLYSYRNEIEIMRLVGASSFQIKGPFLVEGTLFGIFGTIISFVILYLVSIWTSPFLASFGVAPNANYISQFVISNSLLILGLQLLVGITLGAGSSLIAISRYLKV